MRKSYLDNLGGLIGDSLKHYNLEHKTRERGALTAWAEVVGARIAKATSPETIRDGILFVGCKSATWSNELTFLKADIIQKLNSRLGGNYVKDIRFSRRSSPNGPEPPAKEERDEIPQKELEAIKLSGEDERKIEETAKTAASDELAERIRKTMTSARKLEEWKKAHGWKPCPSCGGLVDPSTPRCPMCG